VEAKKVIEAFHNEPRQIMEVHIGEDVIRCTYTHPFFVMGKGWTAASELDIGDHLRSYCDDVQIVINKYIKDSFEAVFNIHVADNHSYFVGTAQSNTYILVHNVSAAGGNHSNWGITMPLKKSAGPLVQVSLIPTDVGSKKYMRLDAHATKYFASTYDLFDVFKGDRAKSGSNDTDSAQVIFVWKDSQGNRIGDPFTNAMTQIATRSIGAVGWISYGAIEDEVHHISNPNIYFQTEFPSGASSFEAILVYTDVFEQIFTKTADGKGEGDLAWICASWIGTWNTSTSDWDIDVVKTDIITDTYSSHPSYSKVQDYQQHAEDVVARLGCYLSERRENKRGKDKTGNYIELDTGYDIIISP
jgi:hypothetical protein